MADAEIYLATTARPRAPLVPVQGGADALLGPGLAAAVGGSCAGLAESMYLLLARNPGTADYSGVLYALLLYGALGACVGVACALATGLLRLVAGRWPDPSRAWTLSFLAAAGGLAGPVSLFILRRDFFGEVTPPAGVLAGGGCGLLVAATGFYLVVRNALAKTFFCVLLRPAGTVALGLALFVFPLSIALAKKSYNEEAEDLAARPVPPELADRPNVLLVVVDTLRADALGAYGAPGDPTPRFDALAGSGTLYERAWATAPWTRPSFASLFTSTPPCTHQCFRKADTLPQQLDTVAEVLQRRGYTTGALINNINVTASFHFHQGFDVFTFLRPAYPLRASEASYQLTAYAMARKVLESMPGRAARVEHFYRSGADVTDAAIRWLLRHGSGRWFLTVHYMDPHDPYFAHPYDGTAYSRVEHPRPGVEEAAALQQLYGGEVRYWDEQFGRLLDWLEQRGLLDSTAIVVTSDHGEEFAEHGGYWHGNTLFEEALRVPLLVRAPDADGQHGRRSLDPVRLIDVAPTIAQWAGAPSPSSWQGTSLLRPWELRSEGDRRVLSEADFEGFALASVRDRDWTFIANDRTPPQRPRPSEQLFFRPSDPREQADLAPKAEARWALEQRRSELSALRTAACGRAVAQVERAGPLTAQECAQLRALGYLDVAAGRCGD